MIRQRIFLCLLLLVTVSSLAELEVGVSSCDINPADGTYLGGYLPSRQSTGIHDSLYAKAVVFVDGEEAVALVVLDSLGVQYDLVQRMREEASARTKSLALAPERIVICSTHTHCSPDVIGIYGPLPISTGRSQEYLDLLVDRVSSQVAMAAESRVPARLRFAVTEGGDWAVNDCEPEDRILDVTILQCVDGKGTPLATLTHFACHPTVLDGDTSLVSADWVGAFYTTMARETEGEHLFLQGGVGGWMQPETPNRSFELAETYGKDLAQRVITALHVAKTKPLSGTPIRFASKPFFMPNENPAFVQMAALKLVSRPMSDAIATEVVWFSVGDAQFATHPGESAPHFTRETQRLMDTGPKFVLGLGLDELGYILKEEYFTKTDAIPNAVYLTGTSPGPKSGATMMAALQEIIP